MLRPEGIRTRLADSLRGNDIDFPGDPVFSSCFHLRGADESALRACFTLERRAALGRSAGPNTVIEACDPDLLVYRPTRMFRLQRFRPGEARSLLHEALALAQALGDPRPPGCGLWRAVSV